MLAVAQDSELDRGATSVAPETERTCALTRELKPVAEMIRFVVGPGRRRSTRRQAKAARPRHLGHRDPRRNRGCGQTQRLRPRFQAGRSRCPRSRRANREARSNAPRSTRWRSPARPVPWSAVFPRSKRRLAGRHPGADPRRRCQRRWQAQAGGRLAPQYGRKIARNRGDRRVYRRPIGFGIEPSKCGTCSPACRAREARLFWRVLRV